MRPRSLPPVVRWIVPLAGALLVAALVLLTARARLAATHAASLAAVQSSALDAAQRAGAAVEQALRQRMTANDLAEIDTILAPAGLPSGARVQIIGPGDHVYLDSAGRSQGDLLSKDLPACAECHDRPVRPPAVWLVDAPHIMRVATPIKNEPRCASCHASSRPEFGVVLVDVSVAEQVATAGLAQQRGWGLALGGAAAAAALAGGVVWLALRRLAASR